jgi:hypothetical protein
MTASRAPRLAIFLAALGLFTAARAQDQADPKAPFPEPRPIQRYNPNDYPHVPKLPQTMFPVRFQRFGLNFCSFEKKPVPGHFVGRSKSGGCYDAGTRPPPKKKALGCVAEPGEMQGEKPPPGECMAKLFPEPPVDTHGAPN